LAAEGVVRRVEVDTLHFKGNFPVSCSMETLGGVELLPEQKLRAHDLHNFENELKSASARAVRFHIYPDGGVSRLRIWGALTDRGRHEHRVRLINAWTNSTARKRLLSCCGSTRWVERMMALRPFTSHEAMLDTADRVWRALPKDAWLEAFAAHPRIGERTADQQASAEQAGTSAASDETLADLARLNREYEAKFGHIYIVCATGKSAEQMLALARERLANDPAKEIAIAAEEQLAITRLRIGKIGEA
jgi:allantoicase